MSDDVDKGSAAMRGSLDGEPTREQAAFHRWQEFCKSCGFRLYDTPEAMSAFLEGLRCGRAERSVTSRDSVQPVAWGVEHPDGEFVAIAFNRQRAEDYATASNRVVPLYRHSPTLTDAEVTFLRRERDLMDADDEGDRKTLEIIAGLLERLG